MLNMSGNVRMLQQSYVRIDLVGSFAEVIASTVTVLEWFCISIPVTTG